MFETSSAKAKLNHQDPLSEEAIHSHREPLVVKINLRKAAPSTSHLRDISFKKLSSERSSLLKSILIQNALSLLPPPVVPEDPLSCSETELDDELDLQLIKPVSHALLRSTSVRPTDDPEEDEELETLDPVFATDNCLNSNLNQASNSRLHSPVPSERVHVLAEGAVHEITEKENPLDDSAIDMENSPPAPSFVSSVTIIGEPEDEDLTPCTPKLGQKRKSCSGVDELDVCSDSEDSMKSFRRDNCSSPSRLLRHRTSPHHRCTSPFEATISAELSLVAIQSDSPVPFL